MATSLAKKDKQLDVATTFNRKALHDLTNLIRDFKKLSPKILARLEKIIENTDDKLALDACNVALKAMLQAAEMRDRDEITRKIAAVKLQGVKPSESEYDNMPRIDFSNIQEVG